MADNIKLTDQESRDRFCKEINGNFSVTAPAGVGKTTAIVKRIVNLATQENTDLESLLPKLVVVTYTQKAASELYQRARQDLLRHSVSSTHLGLFNKIFFGTIHSFCINLLRNYGYRIGLASDFEVIDNDDSLWFEFIRQNDALLKKVGPQTRQKLQQFLGIKQIITLARNLKPKPESLISEPLPSSPSIILDKVLDYAPQGKYAPKTKETQKQLETWIKAIEDGDIAVGFPEGKSSDPDFTALWAETSSPLWIWVGKAGLALATEIAQAYRDYRIAKGFINYDDMVTLASALLKDKETATLIRNEGYRVILDEAQDTDKEQFSVLLGIAHEEGKNLEPGRFCMVGDPQQAIYSSRADVQTYRKIHRDLVDKKAVEPLIFSVTMRCNEAIVKHVNALFPSVLSSKNHDAQIDFVPLQARPWARKGCVAKIELDLPKDFDAKEKSENLHAWEANALAYWIQKSGLKTLNIEDWSEVAILCPRKKWLPVFAKALERVGIPAQIHSRNDIKGDNPAYAWLTALAHITLHPNDSFEITGVLREIFGISDDAIAHYIKWWKKDPHERKKQLHPLNISHLHNEPGPIPSILNPLHALREQSMKLPLREAVQHWIDASHLRERLKALPTYSEKSLTSQLDAMLAQASSSEKQGHGIKEWVRTLKEGFLKNLEIEAEQKEHIQLYTCHKAKGLEWPVVIVPFLYRSIKFPASPYPQIFDRGDDQPVEIAISKHSEKDALDRNLKRQRIHEYERLLYVTATRAKNLLLWVDDACLFPKAKESLGDWLKFGKDAANRGVWQSLPKRIELKESDEASEPKNSDAQPLQENTFSQEKLALAKKNATHFVRRKLPSHLATPHASSNTQTAESGGREYGNWWHKMMETLPWEKDLHHWNVHIALFVKECPLPFRGKKETEHFLNSELAQRLQQPALTIKTEAPFLWQHSEKVCCDGYIDLVAFDSETKTALIIDWKTALLDTPELSALYRNQILSYKEAVQSILELKTQAFIYSTPKALLVGSYDFIAKCN